MNEVAAAMARLALCGGGSYPVGDGRVVTCVVEDGRVVGWGLTDVPPVSVPEEYPGGALVMGSVLADEDFLAAVPSEVRAAAGGSEPDLSAITRDVARGG